MLQRPVLPDLHETITVSEAQISQFRTDGHTLIKNILSPEEAEAYRLVIHRASEHFNTETKKLEDRDTYGKAFLQIMNLWEQDMDVAKFTLAKRFGRIAASLLGVDSVRIYHDQALYKEPGGGFTPWHQDQYYWPVDTDNMITMWMPLIDIDENMGMLTFATASHKTGFLGNLAISDESETILEDHIKNNNLKISRARSMQAGDATWHYGWTLHSAPGNQSGVTREVMTIIYVADGARVKETQNSHQETDRMRWLAGLKPGELIDSVLNPVVYGAGS